MFILLAIEIEMEHNKYNTRGNHQMEADSSVVKKNVFKGDSWRFCDVAKQAKCHWDPSNQKLYSN